MRFHVKVTTFRSIRLRIRLNCVFQIPDDKGITNGNAPVHTKRRATGRTARVTKRGLPESARHKESVPSACQRHFEDIGACVSSGHGKSLVGSKKYF